MPMWLAGEEFGDVHDTDYIDVNAKQQDPVQWTRATLCGECDAQGQCRETHCSYGRRIRRCSVTKLSVSIFIRSLMTTTLLASLPTAAREAKPLGTAGQVIVIANMGSQPFPAYNIPGWRWAGAALTEFGYANAAPIYNGMTGALSLSLDAFEARVFTT